MTQLATWAGALRRSFQALGSSGRRTLHGLANNSFPITRAVGHGNLIYMRCGHCGESGADVTVNHVRHCQKVRPAFADGRPERALTDDPLSCSSRPPTTKQREYARELARRTAHTIQQNELCCTRHTALLIDRLKAKIKPIGWGRWSRAGNARFRRRFH
jgi:hypothetical protein